jgi:putative DNA primase/helicase
MIASLRELARALGGEVYGAQVLAPGPGHSRRDRSLSVKLSATSPNGFIAHSHSGDDWRDCNNYVRERLGLDPNAWRRDSPRPAPTARPPAVPASEDNDRSAKIAAAMAQWAAAVDPPGTPVERYLASRWLDLEDGIAGGVLRWHPGTMAMLALFRDIQTDEPRAVSRTFLDANARKIERRFLGPVGGCAVKLDADDTVLGGLHIGEGIESCLAARQLKMMPCWALGSKGAIGSFPVLAGVEALTILAEPDAAKETEACAACWHAAGREVFFMNAVDGKDANDVLMRRGAP